MIRGLYTSASGMMTEMVRNDVTANNLANVNSTGYKRDAALFKSFPEILVQRVNDRKQTETAGRPVIGSMGTGSIVDEIHTFHEQGQLRETSNPFDLAITGDGFFVVRNENGTFLTRNGSFTLDGQGCLVNTQGAYVMGQAGPVRVGAADNVTVDAAGHITVDGAKVDTLQLVTVSNPEELTKVGEALFTGGQAMGSFTGQVRQKFIEASNVNPITEMVNMITVNRAYEANQKMITAHDQTLAQAIEMAK